MIFTSSVTIPPLLIVVAFMLVAGVLFCVIFFPIYFSRRKYKKFLLRNSVALSQINKLNHQYSFYDVSSDYIEHKYDSEVNFNNVSCYDFAVGYIHDYFNGIKNRLQKADSNFELFAIYYDAVTKIELGKDYLEEIGKLKFDKLQKVEKKMFNRLIQHPVTSYSLHIKIIQVNMAGYFQGAKKDVFNENEIKDICKRLQNKSHGYFNDQGIWNSLVKYERARVSNKLRFKIYERDHYRCCKCGKRGRNDLEIDHIIPISKGGKTEYNNLQTLCRKCNKEKGSKIE